jgi:hypothetical protein
MEAFLDDLRSQNPKGRTFVEDATESTVGIGMSSILVGRIMLVSDSGAAMTLLRALNRPSVVALLLLVCRLAQPPISSNLSPYQPDGGGRRFKYVCPKCGRYRRFPKKRLTPPRCRHDGYDMEYTPRRKKG